MSAGPLYRAFTSALLAAGLVAAAPSPAATLSLEEALAASSPAAGWAGAAVRAAAVRAGAELRVPDCDDLPADLAARLHVQWRFFEVILADLRHAALNEHMAAAYGAFERAKGAAGDASAADLDALEVRYLDLRSRRDAMVTERRLARRHLALAIGKPGLIIDEALEPPPDSLGRALPSVEAIERALARWGASEGRVAARLALERAALEVQQRQGSGRALLRKRMDAAFARVDEARNRLDDASQAIEFGHAMAHSVDARADWLAGEFQLHLLGAWIEAALARHVSPVGR